MKYRATVIFDNGTTVIYKTKDNRQGFKDFKRQVLRESAAKEENVEYLSIETIIVDHEEEEETA